jgi:hypothetical protein
VIAILVADIHLSHTPPIARSAEPDWYAAMARQLDELHKLIRKHKDAIIFCAGDVFDKWNPPVELVNFAIEKLPFMYAVPGQHDLPNHRYDLMPKSAFWTLVKSAIIGLITPDRPISWSNRFDRKIIVHGFPWGSDIQPVKKADDAIYLAVAHKYVWKDSKTSYVGAPKENRVEKLANQLAGFDCSVFGDNHLGFSCEIETPTGNHHLLNCGTFFRRKIDEIDYSPHVGLLHEDGSISLHFMDVTEDKFAHPEVSSIINSQDTCLDELIAALGKTAWESMTLSEAISLAIQNKPISKEAERIIYEAIDPDERRGRKGRNTPRRL